MQKKFLLLLVGIVSFYFSQAQLTRTDSVRIFQKDSTLRALIKADSAKVEKEFAEREKWEKMEATAVYPWYKAGNFSGVIPVANIEEVPDPNIDYKLLFELVAPNPDSSSGDIYASLAEVARKINLHVASGISLKRIYPVIVIHAGALHAFRNNEAYQKKYKKDNPNIAVIAELKKLETKFIVCGQAMAFFDVKKEELLPDMKVAITAQTVLSNYQLKGYVLFLVN